MSRAGVLVLFLLAVNSLAAEPSFDSHMTGLRIETLDRMDLCWHRPDLQAKGGTVAPRRGRSKVNLVRAGETGAAVAAPAGMVIERAIAVNTVNSLIRRLG